MKRKPILTMEEFERAHIEHRAQLRRYAISGRGRHVIGDDVWADLRDAVAGSLKATSVRSRIAFAHAVRLRLAQHMERVDEPFSFVTLCPPEFAMPLSKAAEFDAEALIGWAREVLNSASFIAVIEAAFYKNHALTGRLEPTVSWHVHAITWDMLIAELKARFAGINELRVSFIPGRTVAHLLPLAKSDALARVSYMLKAPLSEYRIYPRKAEHLDAETGEITEVATGQVIQQKRTFRAADAIRMMELMGTYSLPDLTFGSSTGVKILKSAATLALANIEREDNANWARLQRLGARFNADGR